MYINRWHNTSVRFTYFWDVALKHRHIFRMFWIAQRMCQLRNVGSPYGRRWLILECRWPNLLFHCMPFNEIEFSYLTERNVLDTIFFFSCFTIHCHVQVWFQILTWWTMPSRKNAIKRMGECHMCNKHKVEKKIK